MRNSLKDFSQSRISPLRTNFFLFLPSPLELVHRFERLDSRLSSDFGMYRVLDDRTWRDLICWWRVDRSFEKFTVILQWLQHLAILSLSLTWTNPHWKYSWQTLQTSWCAAKEVQFELNRLNGWRGETVKQHFYKVEDNIDILVIMMCWNAKLWIWDTKTHRDMQRTTCVLPITKVRCLHTHTHLYCKRCYIYIFTM